MPSRSRIVYFNGCFVPEVEARVPIYDSALCFGDMAFEVTRTFHQKPYRLREHLERLFHTLGAMRIEPGLSLEQFLALTEETLRRNLPLAPADVDWNIIHNVSRGPSAAFLDDFPPAERRPTVVISCYPLVTKLAALAPAYETGIDLVVPAQRAIPTELLDASLKNRSRWYYQLANFQAQDRQPGSVPVLVGLDGFLTETTSANIFLVRHGTLETPTTRNILSGVTRHAVLDLAARLGIPCHEADLTCDDALCADEMFITSTSIGVIHARSFEGQLINRGQLGDVTVRVRKALDEEVGLDFAAQAKRYAANLAAAATKSHH
jgi:branched-chain amino acid aminotransferase